MSIGVNLVAVREIDVVLALGIKSVESVAGIVILQTAEVDFLLEMILVKVFFK